MSSPSKETDEPTSTSASEKSEASGSGSTSTPAAPGRPPAKRRLSNTVIEISDTESDDSDVCAVNSYQASADEVKRIRGTEYSSSSSSSDYSSDSESSWEDDSILIEDKMQSKVVRTQLNPRAHRMEDPKFNPLIKSQELKTKVANHWSEKKDYSSDEVTFTCEPFRLCLLHNFLANSEIINNIVDDMNTLDWSRKKMDLYEFHQTTDLANLTWQRSIRGIYELLKTEVMSWVSEVTGLELTSVSASCSLYGPGDHLLVHDDLLADRRVAFILYLAPTPHPTASHVQNVHNGDQPQEKVEKWYGWDERMGGALELFSRDEQGRAAAAVRSVHPRNNMLAFFKVGHDSFHQEKVGKRADGSSCSDIPPPKDLQHPKSRQCIASLGYNKTLARRVSEVLSYELPRLSINGWFHGPKPERETPPPSPPAPVVAPILKPHTDVVMLNQWVDAAYMSPRVRAQIQAQMERASEVSLRDLLLPSKYDELLEALARPDVEWEEAGPAQQRRHRRLCPRWLQAHEGPIRDLLHLISSATFVRMLADCTDLQITGYSQLELQQWRPGDFTLLPGREQYGHARLQCVLYLGVPGAPRGGGTSFVAVEEAGAEALLSVPPHNNALSLVYCDAGAAPFTKYYARLAASPAHVFYLLSCCYTE